MSEQVEPEWVFEATAATFEADVLERSKTVPIVVDFWAPWCGPCRQFAPILDKLVEEYQGRFLLAKVNVDQEQELAVAFQVQSIPMIAALRDGQMVDQYLGIMPEPALRQWLSRIVPSRSQELIKQAEELEQGGQFDQAEQLYQQALELSPKEDNARIGMARVLLALSRDEEARAILDQLARRGYLEDEAQRLVSQLELREVAAETGTVEEARKAFAADPDNSELKLKLADVLALDRQFEEACELCLEVFEKDRADFGEAARATLLRIFDLMGSGSPEASQYRRRLASLMY